MIAIMTVTKIRTEDHFHRNFPDVLPPCWNTPHANEDGAGCARRFLTLGGGGGDPQFYWYE